MNRILLTFVILSGLIAIIQCSTIVRTENINEIDPFGLIRDNYGCDAVISSCGKKGKCCDDHDACYKRHGCKSYTWFFLWGNCQACNMAVMKCAVANNPGTSSCCSVGNCGQTRP